LKDLVLKVFIEVSNRLDEQTSLLFSGNNDWAGVAAFEQSVARVQQQPSFGLLALRAVTFVTMFNQQRADFLIEEFNAVVLAAAASAKHERGQQNQHREGWFQNEHG
jgi:hypothetical protein